VRFSLGREFLEETLSEAKSGEKVLSMKEAASLERDKIR